MKAPRRLLISGSGWADGSANAPSGPPQYPALLTGYATRPPWKCAGVDYAVGFQATPTKDPRTSPAGTSYNSSAKQLLITADSVTLDGYDFTLDNGISIYCPSNNNLTIRNSIFGGTNYSGLPTAVIDFRGTGFSCTYCKINGSSTTSSTQSSLISVASSGNPGPVTIEYNWFLNYPQHVLEQTSGATLLTYQFNLIDEYVAAFPGGSQSHCNWLQFEVGTITKSVVAFNTGKQINSQGAEGYQQYFNVSGTLTNAVLSNNVNITTPPSGGMSNFYHGGPATAGVCSENYFVLTGSNGFGGHPNAFYGGSFATGWTGAKNINMSTDAVISFP